MASAAPDRVSGMTTTRLFAPASMIDLIGGTPLVRLRSFGVDLPGIELYAKAEFQNPGGSVKDRAAASILREAKRAGRLREGVTILDATSGNTGIAYAMISAAYCYRLKLCVPSNVTLHKGWFNDTIPKWKADHPGPLAFVHIDCDIYSSTKTILDMLADRIEPGTVIVFDDYFNFPNWENHEHKAFYEYLAANHAAYEPLAYARQQIAVKIKTISATAPA